MNLQTLISQTRQSQITIQCTVNLKRKICYFSSHNSENQRILFWHRIPSFFHNNSL